jgi:hypothetical protein
MRYRGHHHAALFNTDFTLSDRTRLYTQFSFNQSRSSLGDLVLVTTGLPGLPAGYNYANVSDLGDYSGLHLRRFLQVAGMEHRLGERLVLQNELWWHDYKDDDPYLFDTNGRNIGLRFSLHWLF